MGFGIVGNLWKPWAGHHQARRIDRPALQSFDGSSIHRVGFTQIVRMNNEELCAGRVSQSLHQSLRKDSDRESAQQTAEQQYSQDQRRSHCRLVNHTHSPGQCIMKEGPASDVLLKQLTVSWAQSLVPRTWRDRFVDSTGVLSQVLGERMSSEKQYLKHSS